MPRCRFCENSPYQWASAPYLFMSVGNALKEMDFLVTKILYNSLRLYVGQSFCNAMVKMWFSRLLFKIDRWNFQGLNKFTFYIFQPSFIKCTRQMHGYLLTTKSCRLINTKAKTLMKCNLKLEDIHEIFGRFFENN